MGNEEVVYTHGHDESVLRGHRWRTAENSAAYLLPHLRPDMTLLDVGCGPGTITADFAGLVAEVTAVEMNDEALDLARKEFTRRGITNAETVVSDIHTLDFPDDTFDVVHAHQVLQHVGDPVQALREMARVCKPGGIVAARDADYGTFTWYPENPELDRWLSLYHDIARANGGEPDAGRRLRAWAHAAGLDDAVTTASTWCFSSDEDREWWGGSWADRVLKSNYADRAVELGLATGDDLARISDGWRTWAADNDGWFALLHSEILCRISG
ncbi:methyltransferase domain-containing protein [Rhodococcus sp. HM1]|uniref:class I SAM-dependent methyltransferase n=1 Tax=unclassified Rhodococcus (in: high G+C Gram-positive bacteria) TaxID=192944 RepID=UPI0018CD349C|nr:MULTISPECIES: methyltransferase domain-containing protein [unclassified Rhodococcus (in: high G+C Gram-positive bacteria)]MBH0119176.1 methyltransferase domain-containing protein [Rhodococcus sp. CX]MCK8672419.1 methyltransferase domain-containing protein [Rhodococcus sp. HM1]